MQTETAVASHVDSSDSSSRPAMKLVLHREMPADPEFRQQWNALVESMEMQQVFYTWEWATSVCSAYRSDLLLFAAYRADRLAGIVALAISSPKQVSFLTASTADYCDFISAPADRAAFAKLTIDALRTLGVTSFRFANVPADSLTMPALKSAVRPFHFFIFSRTAYLCAQIRFATPAQRFKVATSCAKKAKRKASGLKAAGGFEVVHLGKWNDFSDKFDEFAAAQIGRFLAEGKVSNLVNPERRMFLEKLGALLGERGWLAVSAISVGGTRIAWNFGMLFAGTWFWYQPAFDTDWWRASPGAHLLTEIILAASDNPTCSVVDLGLGAEGYKQHYANSGQATLHMTGRSSAVRMAFDVCRYHAAAGIRKSAALEQFIRTCISRIVQNETGKSLWRRCWTRLQRAVYGRSEVIFFNQVRGNAAAVVDDHSCAGLKPLSLKLLATAAMKYAEDEPTLRYLVRCANRLKSGDSKGFAVLGQDGAPLHFCWTAPFADFWIAELGRKLDAPAPNAVLILDCWTPVSLRRQGIYRRCLEIIATQIRNDGSDPWIFSASENLSSIRGIERAGFAPRFSVTRKTRLAFLHQWQRAIAPPGQRAMDFNTAA